MAKKEIKKSDEIFAPQAKKRLKTYLLAPGNIVVVFLMLGLCLLAGTVCDYQLSCVLYDKTNWFGQFFASFGEIPYTCACTAAGILFICAVNKKKPVQAVLQVIFGVFLIYWGWNLISSEGYGNFLLFKKFGADTGWTTLNDFFFGCIYFIPVVIFDLCIIRLVEGQEKKRLIRFAWFLCFVVAAQDILINQGLKLIWSRPRMRTIQTVSGINFQPWYSIGQSNAQHFLDQGIAQEELLSFPSGHSSNAAVIFTLCALPWLNSKMEKYKGIFFWGSVVFTGCVMLSRIIAGAHFLSDTSVGAAITFAFVVLGSYLFFGNHYKNQRAHQSHG